MNRDYLHDRNILIVSKPLARAVGLHASIALRRVQHWLGVNEDNKQEKQKTHFHDGCWWAKNGYTGWVKDLEVMSYSTVRRTFTDLENLRLLISTSKYNDNPKNETKWWTIDYEHYDAFIALWHEMHSPAYREGSRQSKAYQAFLTQWHLRLATELVLLPIFRTLFTVSRVEDGSNPVHGEQPTLFTVSRVSKPNPVHGEQPNPVHGEQPHYIYRESSDKEKESEESTDNGNGVPPLSDCPSDLSEQESKSVQLLKAAGVAEGVAKAFADLPEQIVREMIAAATAKHYAGKLQKTLQAYLVGALQQKQAEIAAQKKPVTVKYETPPVLSEQDYLEEFWCCVREGDLLGALSQAQCLQVQHQMTTAAEWESIIREAIRGDRTRLDALMNQNAPPESGHLEPAGNLPAQ